MSVPEPRAATTARLFEYCAAMCPVDIPTLTGADLGSPVPVPAMTELGAYGWELIAVVPPAAREDAVVGIFRRDVVAPVVYRWTLTNSYLEAELGWLGRATEADDWASFEHGVHAGVAIGARALRTRFVFPGAAIGLSWERTFIDGADYTTIKLGARVTFDLDL